MNVITTMRSCDRRMRTEDGGTVTCRGRQKVQQTEASGADVVFARLL